MLLKRVPAFALLAVTVWLLVRIVLSAWEWARSEPAPEPSAPPASAAAPAGAETPGARLFGEPAENRRSGGEPGLLGGGDYRLRGVMASTSTSMAHAIIESGGVSRAYFPGDALAAGLTLHEVGANEVRLMRGSEILRLPLSGLTPGTTLRPPSGLPPQPPAEDVEFSIAAVPARMSLSQILRMEPVMETDGSMLGYRVFPRGQRGLFDALGLVSGDLVIAINGVPIDSGNLPQVRQQMSAGGDMMLTVERGGEQLEIPIGGENFSRLAM